MDESIQHELKPASSYEQMIEILISRGLIISDVQAAIFSLQQIGYYRFTGYLLPFKLDNDNYTPGITFNNVQSIYQFDSRFRSQLLQLLERIEIQLKSTISYHLSLKYGVESYRDPKNFNFRNDKEYEDFINNIDKEISRSKELFVSHHMRKYNGRFPIWVALEVVSFSSVSILYKNLKPEDKRAISKSLQLKKPELLDSWLHTYSVMRNKCAHFSRIYSTNLTVPVALTKDARLHNISSYTIFAMLFTFKYLIKDKTYLDSWITQLEALIDTFEESVDISAMGFYRNWNNLLRENPSDLKM